MQWDIVAVVIGTAMIQSLFGVGVLLFGTPLLLVLGYDFLTALSILLPISLTINTLQVMRHLGDIDRQLYLRVLLFAVPCIVLSLFFVARSAVNMLPIVGTFLLFVAMKGAVPAIDRGLRAMVRFERLYVLAMGIVHGLTNLGGSLLTALVHSKPFEKDVARGTTAAAYGTFALFQLATLLVGGTTRFVPVTMALYMALGVGVFLAADRLLYAKLNTEQFRGVFAIFLFASGLVLLTKSLLQ
ncbi:MAG: sulfite exporter TauE/SafE family protein [Nitrospiraceae bacterium]